MKAKLLKLISILNIISLSFSAHLEVPLKRMSLSEEQLKGENVDLIDRSSLVGTLKVGTEDLPLQIDMSTQNVAVNKETNEDSVELSGHTFPLKHLSSSQIPEGVLLDSSAGILGLSLEQDYLNPNKSKENEFVNQLQSQKIIENQVFYFDFPGGEKTENQCKIPTIQEFLGLTPSLIIGDFPYKTSPSKCPNHKTAKALRILKHPQPVIEDNSSLAIRMNMEKCKFCKACVKKCTNVAGQNVLEAMEYPGKKLIMTKLGRRLIDTNCISCGQCTLACNFGCLTETDSIKEVTDVLKNKNGRIVTCQFAPAVRINMAEALGVPPGTISTGKIVTALKMLGFDYVFDTNFAADLTIVEESTELLQRLKDPEHSHFPMFTSCCPAWVNYVERSDPELIPNLSSCRSPLGMLSGVIKNVFPKKIGVDKSQIYNVAFMPCTAKKDEIKRPQLNDETDAVITSRELAKMIKAAKIDFKNLEETKLDTIYSEFTGGGAIFCATGGVMEAAVRAAYKITTGKDMEPIDLKDVRGTKSGIKTATVDINGFKLNVAVAHGIKNAMDLIAKVRAKEPGFENLHFIEVMACPGGCVIGGGSPRPKGKKGETARLDATYQLDKDSQKRTSSDNEQINALYEESFEGEYGSHPAHEILHTYFTNRKAEKNWGIFMKQVSFNKTTVTDEFSQALIKAENNFIVAPRNFWHVLEREFLNVVGKTCEVKESELYMYVVCEKGLNIQSFPTLEFYSDELDYTFKLSGEDLFIEDTVNGNLLLLIVIDLYTSRENGWELGIPFLKKNLLYFDAQNEEIGLCTSDNNVKTNTIEFSTRQFSLFAIVNLSVIIVLVTLVISLSQKVKQGKKKKANELIDDYQYAAEA